MRFVAPPRDAVDRQVFARPPLSHWSQFEHFLQSPEWPAIAALNAFWDKVDNVASPRFVAQTPTLLADGLHYEKRIAISGNIATREHNWHDLLNALIWLHLPEVKRALNARQVAEIDIAGPKQRTRAQCALTHFDEGGAIILVRDASMLEHWDAHDWHELFWRQRERWVQGDMNVILVGHALLEHALRPQQLLVAKTLVVDLQGNADPADAATQKAAIALVARAIRTGEVLNDPQELRPLPLSGIPGWHADNEDEMFYRSAPCFRPVRPGRHYPAALQFANTQGCGS